MFTPRRKFTKPVENPTDYDGTQSLRDYLKHFERCSVVNSWSKDEAAVFLAASLRGEAQKVLNDMFDSDCRNYAKIVDKLELRLGVEKQRKLHQLRLHNRRQQEHESVQAADIRCISSLADQDLSPDTQERFAVQHFMDAIKDEDDRLRLRRDKPCSMDEALSLACELEAFRLLDGDWRRFALSMKLSESLIYLKLTWKCYVMTFKYNNNVRRLNKSLSSNWFSRYSSSPGHCVSTRLEANNAHLLHVIPVDAGTAKSLVITVVTAQTTSLWNKPIWVR